MRKRWLIVTLLLGVLALGITGGPVRADGGDTAGVPPSKSFVARVADKLGLDEAKVQAAFKQVAREMQDEALQKKLDAMVTQGRLTQEQADQVKQWYQARPEAVTPRFPFKGPGFHGGVMGPGHGRDRMGFTHGPFGFRGHAFSHHHSRAPGSARFDWGRIEGTGRPPSSLGQ